MSCRIVLAWFGLQIPPHRESLKDGGRLEEGKPPVSDRQKDQSDNLHSSHEFSGEDTGIREVLVDGRHCAQQKTHEICLDEGPLDLPVVDLPRLVDDDSLGQDQGTGRPEDRPGHQEFSFVFRQKDEPHRGREKEADGPDHDGEHGVDHEQRVEALAWGEIKLEIAHDNVVWIWMRSVCVLP